MIDAADGDADEEDEEDALERQSGSADDRDENDDEESETDYEAEGESDAEEEVVEESEDDEQQAPVTPTEEHEAVEPGVKEPPKRRLRCVWNDPDDEALVIALSGPAARAADGTFVGTKRLRKLRQFADETEVHGIEYEKRLRTMFEKLHPRPVWALRQFRRPAAASQVEERDKSARPEVRKHEQSGPSLEDLLAQEDPGLLRRLNVSKSRGKLQAGTIEIERLRNANEAQAVSDEAAIEALSFHPSSRTSILMTASRDRRLRLFNITGGNSNPLLQTLHIPDMPVKNAMFIGGAAGGAGGSSVLISGERPFLYAWDLQSGRILRSNPWRGASTAVGGDGGDRDLSTAVAQPLFSGGSLVAFKGRRGIVNLVDWGRSGGGSASIVASLRSSGTLAGLAWDRSYERNSDGRTLVTLSTGGEFGVWDTRNLRCEVIKRDLGLYGTKSLECSSDGNHWTVGTDSGIVNVYSSQSVLSGIERDSAEDSFASYASSSIKVVQGKSDGAASIEAAKTIQNLTTAVTTMRFNPDGQVMALASRNKKDAMRLVHFPSMRVFSNWPTSGTPLGHVTGVDFNASSRFVAVGNSKGKVLLYSLRHYA